MQEEIFSDPNPIEARRKALHAYRGHARVLLFKKLLYTSVDRKSGNDSSRMDILCMLTSGRVAYDGYMQGSKGIGLYMILKKPARDSHETDEATQRYLIHGIWNFNDQDMRRMISGLMYEHTCYVQHNYSKEDYSSVIDWKRYESLDCIPSDTASILSIPFNWYSNAYLDIHASGQRKSGMTAMLGKMGEKIRDLEEHIRTGGPVDHAFETSWEPGQFVKTVVSLLNTKGGYLFYGIGKDRTITGPGPESTGLIKYLRYIAFPILKEETGTDWRPKVGIFTYGTVTVVSVKPERGCSVFIKGVTRVLWVRTEQGMQAIDDAPQMIRFLEQRKRELVVDDILTWL